MKLVEIYNSNKKCLESQKIKDVNSIWSLLVCPNLIVYSSNEYSWLICLDTMTTTNVWHTQHILIISSRVVKLVATVWAIIYQHIGLLRSPTLFGPKTLKIKVLTQCLLILVSSSLNTNKYKNDRRVKLKKFFAILV